MTRFQLQLRQTKRVSCFSRAGIFAEKLRATDGRKFYEQAIAKDKNFAMGYVGLANTSGTNKEFVDAVTKAASLASQVSEGERHIILALDSGLKGDPAAVVAHYSDLVRLFPNDERAHTLLGNVYFGRQDYETAVKHFVKATTINPSFSQPYNQLGYAYRFLEKFGDAETAFKKYVELIPSDPNPHDSYAELLMKMGRFDESIKAYEKALSLDPNFVASYVGIGNNHLAAGRPEQARTAFARIAAVARTTGERRLARFWTAASYVHEGATDKALDELRAGYVLAEAENDFGTLSGDLNLMGDVLREAGRLDEATAKYNEAVTAINKAQVPDQVLPNTIEIKAGGVVNFAVAGFHQIVVYQPGIEREDIVLPAFPPNLFVNDKLASAYYVGINPDDANPVTPPTPVTRYNGENRIESVSFAQPGVYLVICNVTPHLRDGMYAYVKVSN